MIETELKFNISESKKKELIDRLGKPSRARKKETSIMYDNKDELMRRTNGRIRVRNNETLTYKRPLESQDGAKREIEHEISFKGDIEPILKEIGFERVSGYDRYRTTWNKDNSIITLDEYVFASFIEIEGKLEEIKNIAKLLGLENPTDKAIDTIYKERFNKTGEYYGVYF